MAVQCKGTCNVPNYALWELAGTQAYRDRPVLTAEKDPQVNLSFFGSKRAITILEIEGVYCYKTGVGTHPISIDRCFWDRSWQPVEKSSVTTSAEGMPIEDCPCTCGQTSLGLEGRLCLFDVVNKVAFRDRPVVSFANSAHSPQPAAEFDYCGKDRTVLITKAGDKFYANDKEIPTRFWDYSWKIYPQNPQFPTARRTEIKNHPTITVAELTGDDEKGVTRSGTRQTIEIDEIPEASQMSFCERLTSCFSRCWAKR